MNANLLVVMTDIHGINATSEVVFALTINGTVVLFLDSPLAVGSNATKIIPLMSQGLTNSMMLNYNQDYTIDLEVDAESSGQSMPEPPVKHEVPERRRKEDLLRNSLHTRG